MTLQEKELLAAFLQQMTAVRAGQKDAEADALIREAVAQQPDAAYLLVQRAMQLEHLLEAAESRARKLQADLEQARSASTSGASGGSFLSDPTWGARPGAPAVQSPAAERSAAAPIGMGTPIGGAGMSPLATAAAPARPGWGSGMLGTVATTAAGVVAGSFLYQGIQGLMHHGDGNAAADRHPPEHQAADTHGASSLYDTPQDDLSTLANISDDDASDTFADNDDTSDFA